MYNMFVNIYSFKNITMKIQEKVYYLACFVALGMSVFVIENAYAGLQVQVNHDSDLELNQQVTVDIHEHIEQMHRKKAKEKREKKFHREIESAIKTNQYDILSSQAMQLITAKEFEQKVNAHKSEVEHIARINKTIAKQDYDAFVAEMDAHRHIYRKRRWKPISKSRKAVVDEI